MKKIVLSLLIVSLIGTIEMPVYAANTYADKGIALYSLNKGEVCDDDFATKFTMSDKKLQQDFEDAMQDNSVKLSESGFESMNLLSTDDYDIDAEYAAEISDYESNPLLTRAVSTVKKVEYGRQWRIYRKSNNATMVKWVLRGLFLYNGKTSQCKETAMDCYNNALNTYSVISKSHYSSGIYAVGSCKAVQKKSGKLYSYVLKFGVTSTGKVVK